MNIIDSQWVRNFINDKYDLLIEENMEEENFFSNILHMSASEVAYLLINICEHYNLSIKRMLEVMGEKLTYKSLMTAIELIRNEAEICDNCDSN